jgi:hypothetical protein
MARGVYGNGMREMRGEKRKKKMRIQRELWGEGGT